MVSKGTSGPVGAESSFAGRTYHIVCAEPEPTRAVYSGPEKLGLLCHVAGDDPSAQLTFPQRVAEEAMERKVVQ